MVEIKPLPIWRLNIAASYEKEVNVPSRKWLQLATVNINGEPRVRTVVFRGWEEINNLILFSDIRSQKIEDIKYQPLVELCWQFDKSKTQFRLRGKISMHVGTSADLYWKRLNERSKYTWNWPTPGLKFQNYAEFSDNISNLEEMSSNFVVLKVNIIEVESLDLKTSPHKRIKWNFSKNWIAERINP